MDMSLIGKVALVTGAGAGIGRAIALTFAAEGARVAVNDLYLDKAEAVAGEIRASGGDARAVQADVADPDQVNAMASRVVDWAGKIDVLCNNAGVLYTAGEPVARSYFWETDLDARRREIDIVLHGVMNCSHAVLPHMLKVKSGAIVNTASTAGEAGNMSKISVYGAGKGGVIAFTRLLATEVAQYNIRVNAVSPELVRTTRVTLGDRQKETNPAAYEYNKHNLEMVLKDLPMGRLGEPEELARVIVFLASDGASFVTGQTVSVNGGQVMK